MSIFRSAPVKNYLLSSLPTAELQDLQQYLTWVRLVPNQVLTEKGDVAEHIYFIEAGLISARNMLRSDAFVQVAMIGREGLVSAESLLQGASPSPVSYVVHQSSLAVRIPLSDLKRLLPTCPNLELACMDALRSFIQQTVETAAFNASRTVAERFIRLLLIMHDRVDGDDLFITHEVSAAMLGTRRSSVTLVASDLQDTGLIQVGRGRITVLDRHGLERQLAQGGEPPVSPVARARQLTAPPKDKEVADSASARSRF